MIGSIIYPPKEITQKLNEQQNEIDYFYLFQIIFMKCLVIVIMIFLPLFISGDTACFILTICIAFQFWTNKNLARKFLKANWFVDTTTQKDRWVFEAEVKPTDSSEGLFWYASLIYMIVLLLGLLYYISRKQQSLSCSILIGLVCGYLNFFAYSKIIKARNRGILQKIRSQVDGHSNDVTATIQLPLITVRSQLRQIAEQDEYAYA